MEVVSDVINDTVIENVAYLKSELIFMCIQSLECSNFYKKELLKMTIELLDSFSMV